MGNRTAAYGLALILAACGGGGDKDPGQRGEIASGGVGQEASFSGTPAPDPAPTSGPAPEPDSSGANPSESEVFSATLGSAPDEGATISTPVRIEVQGNGLENVELLPPDGFEPRLGVFNINREKTLAWLDFDGATLPDGTLRVRVVAFPEPAGQGGEAQEVMQARNWLLRRSPPPVPESVPDASYMPEVHLYYPNFPYVDPTPLGDMMALDDASFESRMNEDPDSVRSLLHQYLPAHVVLMPPVPNGFHGPWYACVGTPQLASCREAMTWMISLMNQNAP